MSNTVIRRSASVTAELPLLPSTGHLVQDVVLRVCSVTLLTVCLWLSACLLVCLVDQLRHRGTDPRPGGPFRPRLVQALVASVLSAVAVGGQAGAAQPSRGADLPAALHGLTVPDRAHGGVRTHEVAAGESLWSITAELLPANAGDRAVARWWPRLHDLNRDRIGGDPDLLRPGTPLRLPVRAAAPHEGAT